MRLEIITGPMFSGKTEELLRRLTRWKFRSPQPVIFLFNPVIDTRAPEELVISHSGAAMSCYKVNSAQDIWSKIEQYKENELVIGIDEAQFLDKLSFRYLIETVLEKFKNATIIVAGLNRDYLGYPFESMESILALADDIEVLTSVCGKCGKDGATMTYRKSKGGERIEIDTGDNYEARHRECADKKG